MRASTPILIAVLATALAFPAVVSAQDAFEIQVYEYLTVPKGRWNLETHFNRVGRGTQVPDGPVAPTTGQNHLTFELTRGITDYVELAGYVLTATRQHVSGEVAGWRVRPRVRLPEHLLPVKVSLSAELGFPKRAYDENSITLEIRPIIERGWGRWQIDINPVLGRALRGPDAAEGWDFEPSTRIGYTLNSRVDLSLEYYGATGVLFKPLPASEQVHQFFPGADINVNDNVVWNVGVGFGATNAQNTLVYKMRLGWMF
ncbi:MAG TPA: hypothetical protein VIP11_06155 [Gemmatimonadaceae bacterium]